MAATDVLVALRNDAARTAARYDEILALRMLLLDMLEDEDLPEQWQEEIERRSRAWGAPGDCV